MTRSLISLQEAASLLGVSTATLRNWDRKGRLKAVRHAVNRYRMYQLQDVLALQENLSLFEPKADTERSRAESPALSPSELRRLVNVLHRAVRDTDGNSSLIERFDELTKILYCKTLDERRDTAKQQPSAFQSDDADDATVASRVRGLYAELIAQRETLFPARFRRIHLSDASLARVARELSTVSLGAQSERLKGLAYEELIKNTFEKGDNQQFFTPPPIVEFVVELARPYLRGIACDPACGTAGFLLRAALSNHECGSPADVCYLGFEIDERLAWAARMNLDMHDVSQFSVEYLPGAGSLGQEVLIRRDSVDIILTNPPFGSDLSQPDLLTTFELGRGRTSRRRGVLFIERCLALVRPGGVVAIVIDDGVLNSPSNTDTREHILRHSDPLAIISLPDTAFMPYATVKSSILLLRKHSGGKQQPLTFFGEAVEVGRKSNGDPLYRVNPVTRKLEPDTDLPTLLSLWNAGQKALQQQSARVRAFWAPIPREDPQFVDAGMRLDLAYHHPARHEAAAALAHARYPLVPLHTLCDVRNEAVVPSQDFQDEEITYIGLANIESHTGEFTPSLVAGASLKSAVKRCLGGDVLFAKMRPELRKVCALPAEHEDAYTSPECLVLVPKISESGQPTVLPELLSHMLRSDLAYGQVVHLVMGIGRPRLNNAAVLNIRLPIPPLDEQQQLLELSKRAEAATAALLAQSERAKEDASELLQRARAELVARLLNQTM